MLLLVTMAITAFAACGEETPPDTPPTCTEHNDADGNGKCDNCDADVKKPDTPPSEPVEVYIIKKGEETNYVIMTSATEGSYGYSVKEFLLSETTAKHIEMDTDDKAYDHEILVGDTSRQLSKDLKADCEEKYADDSHVWGFAYRDGKFAFYFNTQVAFTKGLAQMEQEFIEKREMKISSDTWITNEYTAEQEAADKKAEEDKLKAEEEAKKQVEYDKRAAAAKRENSYFDDADFGVTGNWIKDYSMPTGKDSPYDAPPTSIIEKHPRIYFTEDNIPAMKALLENEEYTNMVNKLYELGDSEDFTGIFEERTHSTGETYRYDSITMAQIEARAMLYVLTGQECYGYEAIMGIKNAMLSLKFTVENHMDVYHGPSHVMFILAEVYDWCYDLLSETDKAQMISGCVYLLIEAKHLTDDDFVLESNKPSVKKATTYIGYGLEFNFPPNNYNAVTGHGNGPQFLRDYMMVTLAFADEMPSWWEYVGGRYYQEYVPATNVLYEGGNVSQGTTCYAPIKVIVNLYAAHVIKLATGENPLPDAMKDSANFMLSHIMSNGLMFETGDGPRTGKGCSVVYCYFYLFAAIYNDTFSLQAAKYYSNNYSKYQVDSIYTMGPGLTIALCASCDEATGVYPDDMPLITYTGYPVGQTTARNGWSEDSAAVFMKINERTLANHDLMDSGTFQIYYKGFLACTSGSYKSYGSSHHKYYLQSTVSMNGLLIYNPSLSSTLSGWYSGSQNDPADSPSLEDIQSGRYDVAKVTGVENAYDGKNAHYAYLAGDITKSYDASTVNVVERRMLTIYTQDETFPMIMLIYDNITSDEANYKKSFLLHTVNEPTVGTNDAGQMYAVVTDGEGKLVLTNVAGGDHIYAIGGEGYAYWIGNENEFDGTENSGRNLVDKNLASDDSDTIWGRVEITANGEKMTRMLNTMYVTDVSTTETLESVAIETDTVLGATVGGNVTAVFVKNINRETGEITFTAEGDETMKYYISGVAAGTWVIYVGGVKVASDEATEDGGFLYFEASAGEITLKPVK